MWLRASGERRGQSLFIPAPVVKKWLSSCANAASHGWGRTDSCYVLLMPGSAQAEPERSDVPTAGLAVPILQPLSCWPCLGPGLCIQPEKLGWAAAFKIKWFSFHSHKRGYKIELGLALLILFMQFAPFSRPQGKSQRGLCSL